MRTWCAKVGLALLVLCGPVSAQQDPVAAYAEALRYHSGDGVVQDYRRAAELLQGAARMGHAPSQNHLGLYYFEGRGVSANLETALNLLEAAAAQGEPQHIHDLAQVLEGIEGETARAAGLYLEAAEGGILDAVVNLGVLYQQGKGVDRDPVRARALYEQAAMAGLPRAVNNLGLLYAQADGVEQDYELAAQLFTQAAEAGLPQAMRNLATLYENGFGVPVDEARAQELYRAAAGTTAAAPAEFVFDPRIASLATSEDQALQIQALAEAGDPIARFQYAYLVLQDDAAPFAELQRAAGYLSRLAASGHGPSMFNLALLYRRGIAVPQDYVLAYGWLLQADASGIAAASTVLSEMQTTLTVRQLNEAQGLAKALRAIE